MWSKRDWFPSETETETGTEPEVGVIRGRRVIKRKKLVVVASEGFICIYMYIRL